MLDWAAAAWFPKERRSAAQFCRDTFYWWTHSWKPMVDLPGAIEFGLVLLLWTRFNSGCHCFPVFLIIVILGNTGQKENSGNQTWSGSESIKPPRILSHPVHPPSVSISYSIMCVQIPPCLPHHHSAAFVLSNPTSQPSTCSLRTITVPVAVCRYIRIVILNFSTERAGEQRHARLRL